MYWLVSASLADAYLMYTAKYITVTVNVITIKASEIFQTLSLSIFFLSMLIPLLILIKTAPSKPPNTPRTTAANMQSKVGAF